MTQPPLRLAVLISGGGTTLRNLLKRIAAGELPAQVVLVVSSSADAGGLKVAAAAGIPTDVLERANSAQMPITAKPCSPPAEECGPIWLQWRAI